MGGGLARETELVDVGGTRRESKFICEGNWERTMPWKNMLLLYAMLARLKTAAVSGFRAVSNMRS